MSQPHPVDPKIWQRCAGNSVKIPKLNSKVYYFPKGHLEHASPFPKPQTISILHHHPPSILCIISAFQLLADPHTDEVFAKLTLTPVIENQQNQELSHLPIEEDDRDDEVVSCVKVLTQSDANNGGAFTVPQNCAKSIFPEHDFEFSDKPSQKLSVSDLQDRVWEFTHVYRGAPKRHLITTGWSSFVTNKKLVAGDSIVFIKDSSGKIFFGIRRRMVVEDKEEEDAEEEEVEDEIGGLPRSGKEMLTENAVLGVLDLGEKKTAFEVVYYPKVGWFDFVVDAEVVEEAMQINWCSGMRVQLLLNKDENLGTISNVSKTLFNVPNWRMLQVNWEDAKIPQNLNCVNPWQIQLIPHTFALYPPLPLPLPKRPRLSQDIQAVMHGLFNSNPSNFLNYNRNSHYGNPSNKEGLSIMSRDQNIDNLIFDDSTKIDETCNCNSKRGSSRSIKILGTTIEVESNMHENDTKGEEGCKVCNKNESIDKTLTTTDQQTLPK